MQKLILILSLITLVYADDMDMLLDGFDDPIVLEDEIGDINKIVDSKPYKFSGNLDILVNYSPNNEDPYKDLSTLKSTLFLEYEHKFNTNHKLNASIKGFIDWIYIDKDDYKGDVYNKEKDELELFETYWLSKLGQNIDIRVGRQIVVWGRSDSLRVTDVINPLDQRKPAIVDIKELRMPVGMVKLDYYFNEYTLSPILIFEERYNKLSAYGGDFYIFNQPMPTIKKNDNLQYGLSFGGVFSGFDFNIYGAKVNSNQFVLKKVGQTTIVEHPIISMFGFASNYIKDSFLFKTELAFVDNMQYSQLPNQKLNNLNYLFGVDYNGILETIISYEWMQNRINNYDNKLQNEMIPVYKTTTSHALRVTRDFDHDRLNANFLMLLEGDKLDQGGFIRAWIKYEVQEALNIDIGYVEYIGGDFLFDNYKEKDRVFTQLSYSF